jgi:hypothetical protein
MQNAMFAKILQNLQLSKLLIPVSQSHTFTLLFDKLVRQHE